MSIGCTIEQLREYLRKPEIREKLKEMFALGHYAKPWAKRKVVGT